MPTPTVHVCPVTSALRAAVLALRVLPAQETHAHSPVHTLPDAEQCPGSQPMAILLDDTVIGYCRIDHATREHAADATALTLRSFQLDAASQGRGLGTAALAALLDDLAQRYPQARRLLLTVSPDNPAALALYRRAGFIDDDRQYHGGRCGPEQVMWRPLP